MNSVEGRGGAFMTIVNMYWCGWVRANIIRAGWAGRKQASTADVTIGRGVRVGGKQIYKKRRFGEEGQAWLKKTIPGTQDMFKALWSLNNKRKKKQHKKRKQINNTNTDKLGGTHVRIRYVQHLHLSPQKHKNMGKNVRKTQNCDALFIPSPR